MVAVPLLLAVKTKALGREPTSETVATGYPVVVILKLADWPTLSE